MIRRPPRSTPFPTRRSSDLELEHVLGGRPVRVLEPAPLVREVPEVGVARVDLLHRRRDGDVRSEEHTSELQSRQYLVCRLLLERKNMSTPLTSPDSQPLTSM